MSVFVLILNSFFFNFLYFFPFYFSRQDEARKFYNNAIEILRNLGNASISLRNGTVLSGFASTFAHERNQVMVSVRWVCVVLKSR